MIQELFGNGASASLLANERNYSSINGGGGGGVGGVLLQQPTTQSPSTSPCPSSTTTPTTATTTPTATTTSENQQHLRCPRCDSSNTKFCYYNNYNLTQPRHFCKTCRRYWTKGGALRNVPIGGGCRKNKSIGMSNTAAKTTTNKMKTVASEFFRSASSQGFDHVVTPPSQILWGSPQNSHILSLFRSSQNQSPNPNHVKEEGNNSLLGSHISHMMTSQPLISSNVYDDGVGHVLCNPFWRNNHENQTQQLQNNGGFVLGEQQQQHHQNSGIQELYQKLRSSTTSSSGNNYCSEIAASSPTVLLGNVASNPSSISNILETTSVTGGELGYWNPIPTLTWSDLPTTNGAYP
ncbi:dof zinc finger protein DOF2.4-like [Trifolium pratense]|uniref:Uncharacterized protein n=1 Tax=Trifolium pratense TaxID=57577 RepID=A0ACB0IUS0_TRIPR|nr:dof zinc finger protein DOF2.4-like [Trifolium pratense]CAJ2635472.1 unnamed protein product [Trifolium pratense]